MAVLDRLNSLLANALTGQNNGREMLEELERAGRSGAAVAASANSNHFPLRRGIKSVPCISSYSVAIDKIA